jgi:hypothetical protein
MSERANPARARLEDMNRREMQLRSLGSKPNKINENPSSQPVIAQVKEDFERILILHNEIVNVLLAGETLDYGFVSTGTAEIKKRATRLQSLLALGPAADGRVNEKPQAFEDAAVKESLVTLCRLIASFATNPMIESPGTVDVELMARARRDLAGVISISTSINKSAAKLSKTAK